MFIYKQKDNQIDTFSLKDKSATILDKGSNADSLNGSIKALLNELAERFLVSIEFDGKTVSITDFSG